MVVDSMTPRTGDEHLIKSTTDFWLTKAKLPPTPR